MSNRPLRLEWIEAGSLAENPHNWRRHPEGQMQALKDVIGDPDIGWAGACLYNERTSRLIDGHARRKAVDPSTVVPVLVGNWSEDAEKKILLTLDPLAALAVPDTAKLKELLDSVSLDTDGLASLGTTLEEDLKKALAEEAASIEIVEDEAPETSTVPARCKHGELWRLGEHRLLCGDSTNAENVSRLLDGAVPFIMVTDPPYGVEYDPAWREQYDQFERHSTGKVQNDHRAEWAESYKLFPGDVAYVWHAGVYAGAVGLNLAESKFEIRTQIIWRKQHFVFGRGSYHWQHEPCWYAVRKAATSKWCGDRKQSTIWDILNKNPMGGKEDDENTSHGTQKPVECMARPIRNHGGKDDDVYDPFGGSGTTLIAAEQLGRKCFMMELSETYCDIIIARWEKLTGKTAEKLGQ